jgi:hypothetical protein
MTTWTTEEFATTTGWMHKCPTCKAARRVDWTHSWLQRRFDRYNHKWNADGVIALGVEAEFGRTKAPIIRCTCGGTMGGKRIVSTMSEHKCDARCTHSRGHVCECSCGGENHGKAFSLMLEMA